MRQVIYLANFISSLINITIEHNFNIENLKQTLKFYTMCFKNSL